MTQYPTDPQYGGPAPQQGGGKAVASLVLGCVAMIAWCCPLIGLPLTITGLILGILDLQGPKRTMAIWGIVLNAVGLLLTIANAIAGVAMNLNSM